MSTTNNSWHKYSSIRVAQAMLHRAKKLAHVVWAKLGDYARMLLTILLNILLIPLMSFQLLWYKLIIFWRNQLGAARVAGALVTLASFLACLYAFNLLLTPISGRGDELSVPSSFVMWSLAIIGSCLVVFLCLLLGSIVARRGSGSRKGNTAQLEEKQKHVRQEIQENRQVIKDAFKGRKERISTRTTSPLQNTYYPPQGPITDPGTFPFDNLPSLQSAIKWVLEVVHTKAPQHYEEIVEALPRLRFSEVIYDRLMQNLTASQRNVIFLHIFLRQAGYVVKQRKYSSQVIIPASSYAHDVLRKLGYDPEIVELAARAAEELQH